MDFNINQLIRSLVILGVGLPVTLSAARALDQRPERNYSTETANLIKASLTEPCLKWAFSKSDSKLERTSQSEIEDFLGGDVDVPATCNYVL